MLFPPTSMSWEVTTEPTALLPCSSYRAATSLATPDILASASLQLRTMYVCKQACKLQQSGYGDVYTRVIEAQKQEGTHVTPCIYVRVCMCVCRSMWVWAWMWVCLCVFVYVPKDARTLTPCRTC